MPLATSTALIAEVRQRADFENSQKVTDTEILGYVNLAARDLYDLLVAAYRDYYLTIVTFTLPADAVSPSRPNEWTLPADFYKIVSLDQTTNATWPVTIHSYNQAERNRGGETLYHMNAGILKIMPKTLSNGPYSMMYVPNFVDLTAAPVTSLDQNMDRWREYITVSAAIPCQIKEESDTAQNVALKRDIRDRLTALVQDRDAGECEQVPDVTSGRRIDPWVFPDR